MRPANPTLDRHTTMGDLTHSVRRMMVRVNQVLLVLLALEVVYLFATDAPGALAFAAIAGGALFALYVWTGSAAGLPLLPMLTLQHLIAYGLPIAIHHRVLQQYPAEHTLNAGVEVFTFLATMAVVWRIMMQVLQPASARAFVLQGIDRDGAAGLKRLGFGLILGSTGFLILQSLELTDFILGVLPSGTYPIVWAALSATSTCGFFLVSMIMGTDRMPAWQRLAFWLLLTVNCLISASGFILSAAATTIVSVMIGQFWSTGRISARFVLGVLAALSFLNLGKVTMRDRYWRHTQEDEAAAPNVTFAQLPAYYAEWSRASYETLIGAQPDESAALPSNLRNDNQSLLERINNLQNLLFVIDAVNVGNLPTLDGQTYRVIPPLLVPRILWPDKPRSHEGQVLLNTHFGRQDLRSTFTTYIAWGLLAEAYGNFGALTGAIVLGAVLGLFCAWAENFTARKPILSTEGFIAFAIFLGLATSYEMVASVMVTSIFQSLVPIALACAPFVRRMAMPRAAEAPA